MTLAGINAATRTGNTFIALEVEKRKTASACDASVGS